MSEFEKVKLLQAHGPDLHFDGRLIHSYSTQNQRRSKERWKELHLWETRSKNWVAAKVGCSDAGREVDIVEAAVIEAGEDEAGRQLAVMEAFGWDSASKAFAREMGWQVVRHIP